MHNIVTKLLILINIAFYVWNYTLNGNDAFTGLSADQLMKIGALTGDSPPETLIIGMFGHLSLFHLIMNMVALNGLGTLIENRFGHIVTLFSYMICGIISGIAVQTFDPSSVTVGASGAVFGLMGMALVGILFDKVIRYNWQSIIYLVAVNLAVTFVVPGVSQAGHIGGMTTGVIIMTAVGPFVWIYKKVRKSDEY